MFGADPDPSKLCGNNNLPVQKLNNATHLGWALGQGDIPAKKKNSSVQISVVDPSTLKLDPDPKFWPNLGS